MADERTVVACRPEDLIVLAAHNLDAGYNRKAPPGLIAQLDPEGVNTFSEIMVHDKKDGEDCEPHMRAMVHAKLRDQEELEDFILDIVMDDWRKLARLVKVGDEWVDKGELITGGVGFGKAR